MVKKTRQKRTHSATRRKKSKRGRGRSQSRTAKRGGMWRIGSVRVPHKTLKLVQMRPPSFSELFGREYTKKSEDPVEGVSAGDTVFEKAYRAEYNKKIRDKLKKQSPTVSHGSSPFTTPRRPNGISDSFHLGDNTGPKYKTPVGHSTEQNSPPPPDLYDGNENDRPIIPFDPREFAPGGNNPSGNTIRELNFDD